MTTLSKKGSRFTSGKIPPSSANDDDLWFNTLTDGFYLYADGVWNPVCCAQGEPPEEGALLLSCAGFPLAHVGVPYTHTLLVEDGTPPFIFSIVFGSLIDGLTLDSATGEISGTPTSPGLASAPPACGNSACYRPSGSGCHSKPSHR